MIGTSAIASLASLPADLVAALRVDMFTKSNLLNAVLFQACWFACVVGGAYGLFWRGVLAVLLLILSLANAPSLRQDVLLAVVLVPVGWLLDTSWVVAGILDYPGRVVAPSWIVLLWLAVALTINHSLSVFRDRPLLGALAVLVAAPLSYFAGARLGAVRLPDPNLLPIVSLTWALLFYLVFRHSQRRLPTWNHSASR